MNYNDMSISEFIDTLLQGTEMTPCLMIGRYVNEFKRTYKGKIVTIYSLEDTRNLLATYSALKEITGDYLVLEGLGYLSETGQNSLLKFIEESTIPIILLSYNDKISPIIMSRMKIIVKSWYPVKSLNFMRPKDFDRVLKEKRETDEVKEYEEIQMMAESCPQAFALKYLSRDPYDPTSTRIKNIILNM